MSIDLPLGLLDPLCLFVKTLTGDLFEVLVPPNASDAQIAAELSRVYPDAFPHARTLLLSSPYEGRDCLWENDLRMVMVGDCTCCDGFLSAIEAHHDSLWISPPKIEVLKGVTYVDAFEVDPYRGTTQPIVQLSESVWTNGIRYLDAWLEKRPAIRSKIMTGCYVSIIELDDDDGRSMWKSPTVHAVVQLQADGSWKRFMFLDDSWSQPWHCEGLSFTDPWKYPDFKLHWGILGDE